MWLPAIYSYPRVPCGGSGSVSLGGPGQCSFTSGVPVIGENTGSPLTHPEPFQNLPQTLQTRQTRDRHAVDTRQRPSRLDSGSIRMIIFDAVLILAASGSVQCVLGSVRARSEK